MQRLPHYSSKDRAPNQQEALSGTGRQGRVLDESEAAQYLPQLV